MAITRWFEWNDRQAFVSDEGEVLGSIESVRNSIRWSTADGRSGSAGNEEGAKRQLAREIDRLWPLDVGI